MLSRSVPTVLFLTMLQACLPPPRAWVVDAVDDSGVVSQSDDTAVSSIPCSAIKFLPDSSGADGEVRSQLSIFHDALTDGGFAVDSSFTVEFYTWFIDVEPGESRTLVSLGQDMAWRVKVDGSEVVFEIRDHEDEIRVDVPSPGFHHVALVYNAEVSPKQVSLYMDGTRVGGPLPFDGPWPVPESDSLRVARAADGSPSWSSQVDLLRFAQSARHDGLSSQIEPKTSIDGWQGIWHFSGDTANALTGVESDAQHVEYDTQVCL